MPNTARDLTGIYDYWHARYLYPYFPDGSRNLNGYHGTAYWTAGGSFNWGSGTLSINNFYNTSNQNEWGGGGGGGGK